MATHKFSELRDKMSPEARERSEKLAEALGIQQPVIAKMEKRQICISRCCGAILKLWAASLK
jgi:hypothetical protein